ncbi:armadillo-type protein [Dichotomopilus funicola]|uniref:Armadillo-type protein n=1 Tax=Dichotomopilus funicola TaxID=1934379 RepID=A0AAN6V2S1_9PEZI|nr:armadillo-type protein [Dichotomopilus funicola]
MGSNPRQHNRFPSYNNFPKPPSSSQSILIEAVFGSALQPPASWNSTPFSDTRPTTTPRDAANAFAPGSSGPGPRTSTGDHDTWRAPYWNTSNAAQTRNLSGNTSPRSRPDAFLHGPDPMGNPLLNGSSMNQRVPGSQPSTTSAAEPSKSVLQPPPGFENHAAETYPDQSVQGSESRFSSIYSQPQRFKHDSASLSAVGSGPRRSISALPEPDRTTQAGGALNDFSFGATSGTGLHSQRPSIAGSLPAHQSMGFDQNTAQELTQAMSGLYLGNPPNKGGNPVATENTLTFNNEARNVPSNPFQQPWETTAGHSNGFLNEPYVTGERRGSAADHNSPPAGNAYRTAGILQSPKSLADAMEANWSRRQSLETRTPNEYLRLAQQQQQQQQQLPPPQWQQLTAYLQQQHLHQQLHQQLPGQLPQQQQQQVPPPLHSFPPNSHFTQSYTQYPSSYPAVDTQQALQMAAYSMGMVPSYGFTSPPTSISTIPTRPAKDQDPSRAYRSTLLLDFKETQRSKKWELRDIWGYVVEFSGDQQGSRFIQERLEVANSDERERVFAELETNAVQLMKDVFGNYVMQKLFEYGDQVQKRALASAMRGKLVDLSLQMYGCRVVQKALKHVLVEQQGEIVDEFVPHFMQLCSDIHANHVIQQAIVLVPRVYIGRIMGIIKDNVDALSIDQYGCRVLQRAMEYGTEADKAVIMEKLHRHPRMLVTHSYGNYVVQHVLENAKPEDRDPFCRVVMAELLTFSKHKHASNVVEKCIQFGTPEVQRRIRDRLAGNESGDTLFALMKDQYGNYVVQTLVSTLQGDEKTEVVNKLVTHLQALKRSGATSRQIDAMEKLINGSRRPSAATSNNHTPASTPPTSPGAHVGTTSAVPTPNLTMDSNSPLSTPSRSPTSMNGNASGSIRGSRPGKWAGKAARK